MRATTTKTTTLAAVLAAALAAGGCANMSEREQGTAKGAGIGAVAGAVLSGVTGNNAAIGAAAGAAIGGVAGNLWSKRMEEKRAAMERATQGTGIEVARTSDNQLKVNVPSDLSFDTGRANIKPELRPVLDQFAQGLDSTTHVRVVGHTDSSGSDAVNNPLSLERARAVERYLEDRGVAGSRIEPVGRGEHEPVADNSTEAGRAKNRRVELFLRETQAAGS
jgi:outer membrane protein OmpA-like peptidoglycan-associated protein